MRQYLPQGYYAYAYFGKENFLSQKCVQKKNSPGPGFLNPVKTLSEMK